MILIFCKDLPGNRGPRRAHENETSLWIQPGIRRSHVHSRSADRKWPSTGQAAVRAEKVSGRVVRRIKQTLKVIRLLTCPLLDRTFWTSWRVRHQAHRHWDPKRTARPKLAAASRRRRRVPGGARCRTGASRCPGRARTRACLSSAGAPRTVKRQTCTGKCHFVDKLVTGFPQYFLSSLFLPMLR